MSIAGVTWPPSGVARRLAAAHIERLRCVPHGCKVRLTYGALEPRDPIPDTVGMRLIAGRTPSNGAIHCNTHTIEAGGPWLREQHSAWSDDL